MTPLVNLVSADGTVGESSAPLTMESDLTIQMLDIELVKSADHLYWGSGPLTYSITISNNESENYNSVVLIDTIDITKVALEENSVEIDGVATAYSYDDTVGQLTVNVGTVAASGSKVITFRVTKN